MGAALGAEGFMGAAIGAEGSGELPSLSSLKTVRRYNELKIQA